MLANYLLKGDRQRIGFFACGTTDHPGPQPAFSAVPGQQPGQGDRCQVFPDRRVPEKAGYADQQFLEKQL